MLPNLFVIGAPKCGTTSLHMYLDAHPSIHMSPVKEPRFFASPTSAFAGPRIASRAEYEALFESAAPVRGESSCSYSQHPIHTGVPERIHAEVPNARFIYLVGDPVRRIVSQHVQRVAGQGERRSLDDAIGALDDPTNPYLCPSRYATQIERYLERFPQEQLLVVDQRDLADDRSATLSAIFDFLGVDPGFNAPVFEEHANVSTEHRRLPKLYLRVREGAPASLYKRVPDRLRIRVGDAVRRAVAPPVERPPLGDSLRRALEAELGEEMQRLRTVTGQPFGGWSI